MYIHIFYLFPKSLISFWIYYALGIKNYFFVKLYRFGSFLISFLSISRQLFNELIILFAN